MKKYVNIRLPVIFALCSCCGIFTGTVLNFYGYSVLWALFFIVPAAAATVFYGFKKRKIIKPLLIFLLLVLLFAGGASNAVFRLKNFSKCEIEEGPQYLIEAKVAETGKTSAGDYLILDNIRANGTPVGGKMKVYLSGEYGDISQVGYSVSFVGAVEKNRTFLYGELNRYAFDGVKYISYVNYGLQSVYGFDLFGQVRQRVKNVLYSSLNKETAAICYGMLTGNTEDMESGALNSFRYGGIAHIFAVSGLHIGIIYAVTMFILKLLGVGKRPSTVIATAFLLVYCAFCGYSLSALRATIMCAVTAIAFFCKGRYDGLNSLAAAVLVILAITPLNLFSVGFQLSVCAMGGIYAFSPKITQWLQKIKIPQKISSAMGVSFGAQLCTLPVMLGNFGYLSGAGLVLNLLVLPIMSVAFAIVFVSVFICTALPVLAPVLKYAVLPLEFMMSIFIGAGFENSLISGFGAGWFALIYFVGILCLTDKINFKFLTRIIGMAVTVAALTAYILFMYNFPLSGYALTVSAYNDGGEVLIRSKSGNVLVLTEDSHPSRVEDMLNRHYCVDVDAVIGLGINTLYLFPELDIDCKNIYLHTAFPQVEPFPGKINVEYADKFELCGIKFGYIADDVLTAEMDGVVFCICGNESFAAAKCNVLICDSYNKLADCDMEVYFNDTSGPYNVADCGDITFLVSDGRYSLNKILPSGK